MLAVVRVGPKSRGVGLNTHATPKPTVINTTSSSPPQELKSSMFTGSEASRAMREIRVRDQAFDMNRFVQSVKLDAPVVVSDRAWASGQRRRGREGQRVGGGGRGEREGER